MFGKGVGADAACQPQRTMRRPHHKTATGHVHAAHRKRMQAERRNGVGMIKASKDKKQINSDENPSSSSRRRTAPRCARPQRMPS